MIVHGRLEAFWETGTEGVHWSLTDSNLPGYDALYGLFNGDRLRIIGAQDETLWDGIINLEYKRNWQAYPSNPSHGQQAVLNHWVHGLQTDVDPECWANWFFQRYRAELTLGPQQTNFALHPFVGPSISMEQRLRAVEEPEKLYHSACYPWLVFYSDGDYASYAKHWNFTLDETLQLLGNPTEAQLEKWKGEKRGGDTLMPFDWDRFVNIALLFGVYGGLEWKFHDRADAVIWLNESVPSPKQLLLSGIDGIISVRDMLSL